MTNSAGMGTLMIMLSITIIFSVPSQGQEQAKAQANTPSNTTKTKPVEGYDNPQGYFTAIRHVYNDPNLRISAFCKPSVKIVATCQIYDGSSTNATLIGVEYIISAKDYNSLPASEKTDWYIINKALANTVQGKFPELNAQQTNIVVQHLLGNYGKTILLWNPLDKLPSTSPRTENLQSLFVVNRTNLNSSSTSPSK